MRAWYALLFIGLSGCWPLIPGKWTDYSGGDTDTDVDADTDADTDADAPIADAGADQNLTLGATATLSGSASSDPAGGKLTYVWTLADEPYTSALDSTDITSPKSVTAKFKPDVVGDFTLELVVSNGTSTSEPSDTVVHVKGGANKAPTADAGTDISGTDCAAITVDCSKSSDPDGDALQYLWTLTTKPTSSTASNTTFVDRNKAKTTFYADQPGKYTFSCAVTDGTTWSDPDSVNANLTAHGKNKPPIARAGADRTLAAGTETCVADGYGYSCPSCAPLTADLGTDGAASDPDGDAITIQWTVEDTTGAVVSVDDALKTSTTLPATTPMQPGACVDTNFRFLLSVTDCPGTVTSDEVILTAECCGQ